ncbi:sensor histidine kinase [Flavobacteriaceae bacterium TP-CH-4]|uniref:histidine kinase n=1 Tax=Pelagihabitans pacificus TaxID=2696054 RepID=A0A967EC12_9FLAO|nr:sensor histidine kinase [Pelagihabitans pacificus]NHF57798.1 sensor histidine kinase [Pelagihabitans pacificus]
MKKTPKDHSRIADKTRLLLKFNYVSAFLSLLFGLACHYYMQVSPPIPYVFLGYSVLNLCNNIAFYKHRNLVAMAIVTSVLSLISTLIITMYSGGIQSPFIFVLAVIVLAGYISTSVFGKIYLYAILVIIGLIYLLTAGNFSWIVDGVPATSKDLFSLLSLTFSIYLMEGVFGRDLLKAHDKLFRTKQEVEAKIKEKENLLKEVHHRVKNNLQTISSLLSLQSRNIQDADIKKMLKSSQNRVIAMAMIHEMLYLREDSTQIDYGSYVRELVEHLVRSVKGTSANIDLDIDIPEMTFNIDTAIPLGLLVNEAVTNTLKYGILEDSKGQIFIRMRKGKQDDFELYIGDNGVGFSEETTHRNSKSLGLKLIHKLVRQLRGSLKRDASKKGTHYIIHFKEISDQLPSMAG